MLHNLRAEMARRNITTVEVAKVTGKSARCVRDKISGKRSFTLSESCRIRDALFPALSLEYLFAEDGDQYAS